MGWERSLASYSHWGKVHSNFLGTAELFSWSHCSCWQHPLQAPCWSGSILEENFLFSWGPALYFLHSSGSLTASSWERFLPLGKTFTASCLFKITTNSSSWKKISVLEFGRKRELGLPFCSPEEPGAFAFPLLFRSLACFPHSSGYHCCFLKMPEQSKTAFPFLPLFSFFSFFCFSSFLVISATNSSCLSCCVLHNNQILSWNL